MKVFRYLLPVAAIAVGLTTYALGSGPETEQDMRAVKDFIKGKRAVSIQEKGGDLSLSGDVRFEYQSIAETRDGVKSVGSGTDRPNHLFDAEVNLMLDYKADDTWGSVKIEFDNDCGNAPVPSGSTKVWTENSVKLQRAYLGYNIIKEDTFKFDVELGRRKLHHTFDSKVQFDSIMDGVLLKYSNSLEDIGDVYVNVGIFSIDGRNDHFGEIAEVGLMDIADTGAWAKYSYIDWSKTGWRRTRNVDHTFKSRNSQVILGYKFMPEMLEMDLDLYGSFLWNHAAKKRVLTDNSKENKAWYLGFQLGKVEYAGDWSLDVNYQYVEAQAVRDFDVAGIGRGNIDEDLFETAAGIGTARGNANYKGFAVEALYALTDNLTFSMEYETSDAAEKKMGGRHGFHKFEIEAMLGF